MTDDKGAVNDSRTGDEGRTYTVTFDRIGRNHNVAPMTFEDVSDPDELAGLIYERCKRYLMSRYFEVEVDLDELTGRFYAGMRAAGSFTIAASGGES